MWRILLFVSFFLLVGGCDNREIADKVPPRTLMVSLIPYYEDNEPFNIILTSNGLFQSWFGKMDIQTGGCVYSAPELGSKGEIAERFLEIAERNGDRSYNRYENWYEYGNRRCLADNYKEVHAKCLNAPWDDSHPAGSSLDDILEVEYVSCAEYVRKGYPDHMRQAQTYRKKLSEIKEDDMWMINPYFYFHGAPLPLAGSYEMEVTLVTTEGVEKTATCTLVIE